ncbi:MAG TPA: hypothetical protein DDW34_01335 [Clostridium sp.]|nr:hypothetical protein [Clostridium sp.]
MEKYFEISKVHELYARYFEWLEFREKLIEIYKEFAKKAGIESMNFIQNKMLLELFQVNPIKRSSISILRCSKTDFGFLSEIQSIRKIGLRRLGLII